MRHTRVLRARRYEILILLVLVVALFLEMVGRDSVEPWLKTVGHRVAMSTYSVPRQRDAN
jgi:hypothetical protein